MINISELRVVEDTFFRSRLAYYKPSLYKLIQTHFNEENEYSEATLVKLKNIMKGNKDYAFNTILKKDMKAIEGQIPETPKQFDETLWRDMLPKIREEVKKTFGLDFKPRSIFFQDSFPEGLMSYEKKGASSITIFEGNEGAGIYFLNKRVSSFFTPILMIHEQLHSCLSQNKNKDQMYIEWFEEGLCQWYSLKIYFNLTKNMDVMDLYKQRCYIYSKVKDEHNFTRRYYEYMKIMSRIYLHGGQKLIGKILVDYLSNKRKEVNSYLDTAALDMKTLPEKDIDNYLVNFSFDVEPEKLPPVEYLVMKAASDTVELARLPQLIKAPDHLIGAAIIALQVKGMIFIKETSLEMNWRKKDLFDRDLIKPYWPME